MVWQEKPHVLERNGGAFSFVLRAHFVCTGTSADENYNANPVITIKILSQLVVFDPLAIMERDWGACDKNIF
jgi:hypothetical protein